MQENQSSALRTWMIA